MSSPFESYDDLEGADERLQAADPAERRVAIIALGHSGDPAAIEHLARMVSDPDAGVRQQVAMALGEFDGPEAAGALARLLVDPERIVAAAAADSGPSNSPSAIATCCRTPASGSDTMLARWPTAAGSPEWPSAMMATRRSAGSAACKRSSASSRSS